MTKKFYTQKHHTIMRYFRSKIRTEKEVCTSQATPILTQREREKYVVDYTKTRVFACTGLNSSNQIQNDM